MTKPRAATSNGRRWWCAITGGVLVAALVCPIIAMAFPAPDCNGPTALASDLFNAGLIAALFAGALALLGTLTAKGYRAIFAAMLFLGFPFVLFVSFTIAVNASFPPGCPGPLS